MLIEKVKSFVIELLSNQLPFENYYHNLTHTKSVVETAILLAKKDNCTEEEAILVQIAAWFHDVGYIEIDEGHEEVSKKIAANFLEENGFNNEDLKIILQLIDVTKINSIPTTSLEKIIKDADCGHVISEDFLKVSEKLRIELNCKKECNINEIKWLKETQSFLEKAQFYTEYAKENWQTLKEINQYKVQQKIDKLILKSKEKKNIKVGRGVETLFRVQLKNHIELSSIADTKANILLSVNAIIISVTLSSLIPKLDSPSNMFLVTPTLILTIFSVASIVLSVLSTRPKISNVKVTQEMIKNKQTNILFFGNFYKMSIAEFEWGINHLIENEDVLYDSLTKDLYYLGLVLKRKYKLLRLTYTVFMIGIIISALAFVISYHLNVSQ